MNMDQLSLIMPNAQNKQDILDALNESMPRFGIDQIDEQCMFLANIAHESGEYRWLEEIWGPTSEQLTYERDFTQPWGDTLTRGDRNYKAHVLGNDEQGDGKRFKGHGPIQITGKTNHVVMGFILEKDFLANPSDLATIATGTASACAFWENNNLDAKVKQGFVRVVKAINGGTNGLADRQKYLARAQKALGK